MVKVELSRFKVKKGKEKKVQEWMNFLNQYHQETVATMAGERMYVEDIFKEVIAGETYLYWFSIQGENGNSVEKSNSEIDKKHLEYWKECIDTETRPKDLGL